MKGFFNVLDHSVNKTNNFTTLQNARMDVVGELEAIIQYENHLMQSTNPSAQNVIKHIVNEEKTHVGELMGLIFYLDPESKVLFEKGLEEFNKEYKER